MNTAIAVPVCDFTMDYTGMFDLQRWLVQRSTAVMSPLILLQSSLTQRSEM